MGHFADKKLVAIPTTFNSIVRSLKRSPSPLTSCLHALRILTDLSGHFRLVQVLSLPSVVGLAHRWPKLSFKYLRDYLSRDFSRQQRLKILTFHYSYLASRVDFRFLGVIFDESLPVWQDEEEGHSLSISINFPASHDLEGDICLTFELDLVQLYEITFTIVPAISTNYPFKEAILISHIQGSPQNIELIREATKLMQDTAPQHILLAAVEAIACSLQISVLMGIGNRDQLSRHHDSKEFIFSYDNFWKSLSATEEDGFYFKSVPSIEKSIMEIKKKHRKRAIRRRDLRKRVFVSTQVTMERFLKTD